MVEDTGMGSLSINKEIININLNYPPYANPDVKTIKLIPSFLNNQNK